MILSYTAVTVFAYAILLNIFYLYSPVESGEVGGLYESCEECLASDCHVNGERPCIDTHECDYKLTCFTCETQDNWKQFYSKDECQKGCEAKDSSMMCICDRWCYMCVEKDTDSSRFPDCYIPDIPEEPTCV